MYCHYLNIATFTFNFVKLLMYFSLTKNQIYCNFGKIQFYVNRYIIYHIDVNNMKFM